MNKTEPKTSSSNPAFDNQMKPPISVATGNTQLYGDLPPKVQTKTKTKKSKFKRFKTSRFKGFLGLFQLVVSAFLLALIINSFIFQSYQVVGESMHPTLSNGDRLVITKIGKSWSRLFRQEHIPKRGQIIIFDSPLGEDRQLVKRVIGIPGDKVVVNRGVITIFNTKHPEGFNPDENISDTPIEDVNYSLTKDVGKGELFVSGDNRVGGASLDSRNDLGLVPIKNVIGELVIRLLPLSDSRLF